MRTIYNPALARLGGNGVGPRNQIKMFNVAGTFDWVVPETIDPNVPLLVRVWGGGGACGLSTAATGVTEIDIVLEPRHVFEHAVTLNPGGIIYRTALILGPGDRLYAQADTDTVALTAWGISALI